MPLIPKTEPPYYTVGEKEIKIYTALLTQSGTNAPVGTILQNGLDGIPTFGYSDVGRYNIILTGAFLELKIAGFIGNGDFGSEQGLYKIYRVDNNTIRIVTQYINAGSLDYDNGWLANTPIEIRVYS